MRSLYFSLWFVILGFLPQSAFSLPPASLNVLLYGDAGNGDSQQVAVGQGMAAADRESRFDFALSTGDNQYVGLGSEVMKQIFEDPYKTLIKRGLVFYQTLGNHDMEFGRKDAQLKYSRDQNVLARGAGGWVLPAEDYEIKRGEVKFIVTNTSAGDLSVVLPQSRMKWLEEKLCGAKEKWVFLVMHYPFWSSNHHGDNKDLQKALMPLLGKCKPDALLAGHDHGAEILKTPLGIRQFVIGNGREADKPDGHSTKANSEWQYGEIGFAGLRFNGEHAEMTYFDKEGVPVHSVDWKSKEVISDFIWGERN